MVITTLDINTQETTNNNLYFSHYTTVHIFHLEFYLQQIQIHCVKMYDKHHKAALIKTLNHLIDIFILNSENPTLRVCVTTKSTGI